MPILAAAALFAAVTGTRVDVRLVTDEAEAVMKILDKRAAHETITEADWQLLFKSEGFVRLQKRENSMHRTLSDDEMKTFVTSDELLAKRESLGHVLNDWKTADLSHAADLALAYLPPTATIRAKIYPVIKPQKNSFVFETDTDPAIFKYIEEEPRSEFERTMSHEMHHIGFAVCSDDTSKLPKNIQQTLNWITAFGEGHAVLAAAGGPDKPPQERYAKEWKDEMAKFDTNFHDVESFLLDVAEKRLSGDEVPKKGFTFFGLLGPWYTVGWKMDVVIEKTLGRDALIDAECHPRTYLATYNRAADLWEKKTGEKVPRWSQHLIDAVSSPSSEKPAR